MNSKFISLLSTAGILLFAVLYCYAASLYPGGSQADINSIGFDWMNNYWCNLMNATAMNGAPNPGKNIAVFANAILCFSLMLFFIEFADTFSTHLMRSKMIKIGGILSMIFAVFIFTPYHDLFTIVSSLFGLAAVIGVVIEIYQSQMSWFKLLGAICLLLLIANNLLYYTTYQIQWLPFLQKVTFVLVLLWILGLNREMWMKK